MDLPRYRELGQRIEAQWASAGRDVRQFPAIAEHALTALDAGNFSLDAIGAFLVETTVVQQPATKFSNMPVTVFTGDGFYIEMLVWTKGTTSIHQHGFSGAFRVLSGSSLHTDYRFRTCDRRGDHLALGEVQAAAMRLLRTGDVMRIESGPEGLIHALFHLDNPSVTLVVRTVRDVDCGPQFELIQPGIALDTPWIGSEPRAVMLSRWLKVCKEAGHGRLGASMLGSLMSLDPGVLASLALEHGRYLGIDQPGSGFGTALEVAHPGLLRPLVEAFRCRETLDMLAATRNEVDDPELRFFVALLLNAPYRGALERMVLARHPQVDARDKCVEWLLLLGDLGGGTVVLSSRSPWRTRLAVALGNAGADAGNLLQVMWRGTSIASSPEFRGVDPPQARRLAASERALRTMPGLDLLFGTRGTQP